MGAEQSTAASGTSEVQHAAAVNSSAGEEFQPSSPCALVVVGPSGVGKGTLIKQLVQGQAALDTFGFSVSHTTRQPRTGEKHGDHYYFTTKEQFAKEVAEGRFLEWAQVHNNLYGTSLAAVRRVLDTGRVCILEIDVQGAKTVRRTGIKAIFVFVAPPSLEDLARRLVGRGTESVDQIKQRLSNAKEEINSLNERGLYDYLIINDNLEEAEDKLRHIADRCLRGLEPEPGQVPESVIIEDAPLPDLHIPDNYLPSTGVSPSISAPSPSLTTPNADPTPEASSTVPSPPSIPNSAIASPHPAPEAASIPPPSFPAASQPAPVEPSISSQAPPPQVQQSDAPTPPSQAGSQGGGEQVQESTQRVGAAGSGVAITALEVGRGSGSESGVVQSAAVESALPHQNQSHSLSVGPTVPPSAFGGKVGGGLERWEGKVALVTGSSSGIGWSTCVALATQGLRVVAVARRKDRLEALQSHMASLGVTPSHFLPVVCDITKDAEVATLPRIVDKRWPEAGGVDILINNAGLSRNDASLMDGNVASWVEMLSTNVLGTAMTTRAVLQDMKRRGRWGHIINMVGLSGHRIPDGPQGGGFYCATKAAVKTLTEGLRQEARGQNLPLRVSAISPGIVETEFFAVRSFGDADAARRATSAFTCLKPEDIAAAVLWCLSAPQHMEVNDVVVRPTEQLI